MLFFSQFEFANGEYFMMKTMVWVDLVLDYPLDAADRRSLYNEEYVASGCVGDFPEGTDLDDTVGTWSTNYVTFGLCLLTSLFLVYQIRRSPPGSSSDIRRWAFIVHLLILGSGFCLAAVAHQVIQTRDEYPNERWFWNVALSFVVWSLPFLIIGQSPRLLEPEARRTRNMIVSAYLFAGAVVFSLANIDLAFLFAGVCLLVTSLVLLVWNLIILATGRYNHKSLNRVSCILWIFSQLSLAVGLLVQVILAPVCSHAAYQDCFEDCPLPYDMNHNFVYHIFQITSVLFVSCGALVLPMGSDADDEQQGVKAMHPSSSLKLGQADETEAAQVESA
jgi:hypothetical protein